MSYKIDIYHRDKNLTFGPRFKGEVGKDIFAAKVALGLLVPMSESGEIDTAVAPSYDANIPLDQQKWFDCSTGLGVDVVRATTFDTSLENALLTFQINNQFLITAYYFEKFGYRNLLNSSVEDNTVYEAEILSELAAATGLFESELRTLGEATIAILHGWRPATRLIENTSYTHDSEAYSVKVDDVLPIGLYEELMTPNYPQNYQTLVDNQIVVPLSLERFDPNVSGIVDPEEFTDKIISENRNWAKLIGEEYINFEFATISYVPVFSGNSPLYSAATKVIDYYLENNLFSQQLSQEELVASAQRALYPDPFSRSGTFIIDGTRLGIYTETEFFLRAEGPLPNEQQDTIALLEEKALIQALEESGKPKIWNFFKDNIEFNSAYFLNTPTDLEPGHSGVYPRNITRGMLEELQESYDYVPRPDTPAFSSQFKKDNYWVLTTSDITSNLEEDDNSVEYWRIIDNFGNTEPLIKFVEYITPSLRPGQSYRALFEINRQKFEAIINGDNLVEQQEAPAADLTPTEESACLDQNSEQAQRTYEEYKAHAIKKRRDLVRLIREEIQKNNREGARVDFGAFDSAFSGLNVDSYTDYELMQKAGQLLGSALPDFMSLPSGSLDFFSQNITSGDGSDRNNADNDRNKLQITFGELKERIEMVVEDLKESAEIIQRERIRFEPGSDFNGNNEALNLSALPGELAGIYANVPGGLTDETTLTFQFKDENKNIKGHKNGKRITSVSNGTDQGNFRSNRFLKSEVLNRPRTINYLSQIKDMTSPFKMSRFFDDARGACKDLTTDLDKMTAFAFVTKYTSGLKAILDKSEGFSFKSWWDEEIVDPIKEYGQKTADNFNASLDTDNFDKDAALRALGKECNPEKMMREVFKKLNLSSLLCDYIKCLKLPSFDIKLPDFNLPVLPKIGIIGWYEGLLKFIRDQWDTILKRIVCTAARMIIDKLAFPFCEEQLQDFIRDDLLSEQDFAKRAVIESLTRTGVTDADKAKNFFDSVSNILTGRELCYVFQGNRPDDATMTAMQKLAETNGVSGELQTPEDIINFFGVIGSYIPDEFCDLLSQQTAVQPTNCDDTNDLLRSIRNRLQTEDSTLTEDEINNAVALAEKNKQEEADRLEAFFQNGFNGMVPPIFDYGNPNAILQDFPEHLKREQEKSATSLFAGAQGSYVKGLAKYVPSMRIQSPVTLWPYDERYDEKQVLRMEATLQQLKDYGDLLSFDPEANLGAQFATLHQLYQTEIIEKISGNLIPEEYRIESLIVSGSENQEFPDYYVPHDTILKLGIGRERIQRNAVRVHKRKFSTFGSKEEIENQIIALQVVINRYETRIGRTSGAKRDRLRAERRPIIANRDRLQAILNADGAPRVQDLIVPFEEYMAYQSNIGKVDSNLEPLEFELVPFYRNGLYSMDFEYANFESSYLGDLEIHTDPVDEQQVVFTPTGIPSVDAALRAGAVENILVAKLDPLQIGGNRVLNSPSIAEYFRQETSFAGDDEIGVQHAISRVIDRTKELNDRLIQILQNTPQIMDDFLFPGLQESLTRQAERALEDLGRESVAQEGEEWELKFNAGAIYSPSITMVDLSAAEDKDRYDIRIEGDFYTGLDLASSVGPAGIRNYRYCDQLPEKYSTPRQGANQGDNLFGKRNQFKNLVFSSLKELGYVPGAYANLDADYVRNDLYKETTETMFEILLDSLYDSGLFNGTYTSDLDARVAGKRQINQNCVSNRFSFGAGSVVSFQKAIIGDVSAEIAKEMSKPENAPQNYDFDSPSGFDLAMQNLAMKGFVRVCLMDLLLKGGIAYSVWDIEPIVGEEFFIDYAISHVKAELEANETIRSKWGRILERVTGISSKEAALKALVKEELLKLPNYSKQVYHPTDNKTNFYNWFFEVAIPQFEVSSQVEGERFKIEDTDIRTGDKYFFLEGKPTFIVEHFIRFQGQKLVEVAIEENARSPFFAIDPHGHDLVMSMKEFQSFLYRIEDDSSLRVSVEEILNKKQGVIQQGSRLVLIERRARLTTPEQITRLKSLEYRSYQVKAQFRESEDSYSNAFATPLAEFLRPLDFEECYKLESFSRADFREALPFMIQELSNTEEYKLLFENIFPVRRLMSIVSVFATSVVSGYNTMPNILTPTKTALASVINLTGMGRRQRSEMTLISREEFTKQMTENFPTSDDACLQFPGGFEDIFKRFIEELIELIKMMPSIIFRGVANQLDPAYKEMRQHYLNCDIKQLSHRGTKYGGTVDYKLVNGLYLQGRKKGSGKADQSLMQKGNGKYVPLFPGALVDILDSVAEIPDFPEFGRKLGTSIAKLVTYIYSGNAPFLDPSAYFKIPCADIDYSAWTEGGRYDAGKFGRYGHPLSPFTILALSTLELESDKRLRENNCIEEMPKDDCEDLDPNEIVYTSETEQVGSQGMGPTGPNELFSEVPEEVREGERQAIRDEIEQNRVLQEERDSLTEEQRRELLEQEFMSGVETEFLTQDDPECVVLRKQIRVLYNELSEVSFSPVVSALRTQISQKKRELANLGFCVGALQSFRGPTPEEQIRDYVIVRLIEGSRVVDEKQVQIEWRAKYSTEGLEPEVDGFFKVYTRQEYDNFR